jgi:hypothetical protein
VKGELTALKKQDVATGLQYYLDYAPGLRRE